MDNQLFPPLNLDHWVISTKDIEARMGGMLDSAAYHSPIAPPVGAAVIVASEKVRQPISSIMERNVCVADADDTVEKIEEVLSAHGLSSVAIIGSNGVVVGIIGSQELTLFLLEKKNAKAVRAWEISRCKMFEVNVDASIEEVTTLMLVNNLEYIAVTEFGALRGQVSLRDLALVIFKKNTYQETARGMAPVASSEAEGRPARRYGD